MMTRILSLTFFRVGRLITILNNCFEIILHELLSFSISNTIRDPQHDIIKGHSSITNFFGTSEIFLDLLDAAFEFLIHYFLSRDLTGQTSANMHHVVANVCH